ncbi:MAG: LpqB family beta-propeller domain-containing protein [Actinomycetales bacterium]
MARKSGRIHQATWRSMLPLLVLVLLVPAVSGCAQIPASGPVVAGEEVDPGVELHAIVPGPAIGASPSEIVNGFIQAMISAEGEYEVARSYLTPAAAARWKPSNKTYVFADLSISNELSAGAGSRPEREAAQQTSGILTLSVTETIDADGHLAQVYPPQRTPIDLDLTMVDDEWRIDALPDATLLAEIDLDFVFSSYNLYYLDPARSFLVADPRWLPDTASTPARIAALLLRGPPAWLRGAVVTAFPKGTQLRAPAGVQVQDGVAQVSVTPEARQADAGQRGLMRAQLLATLQPVVAVQDVQILVDSARLDVDEVTVHSEPSMSESPALLMGDRVQKLVDGNPSPVESIAALRDSDADALAMDYSSDRFAILADDRKELRLAGEDGLEAPVLSGDELTVPSFDWRGWVWSTEVDCQGQITAVSADSEVVQVHADWLAGRELSSLRVARDGVRVLIASTDAAGTGHLELAAITRDEDGVPHSLARAPEATMGSSVSSVRDAAWVGPARVVVLGTAVDSTDLRVLQVEVGGPPREALPRLEEPLSLTAATGMGSVLVSSSEHDVLTQAGAQWISLSQAQGATWVAFPG